MCCCIVRDQLLSMQKCLEIKTWDKLLEQRKTDLSKTATKKRKNDVSAKADKTQWQESEINMLGEK